jgi:hypothetical protein
MLRGTPMTITERNQKLYDLRKQLHDANLKVMGIKAAIIYVNEEYDRQNRPDLFTEMFGEM